MDDDKKNKIFADFEASDFFKNLPAKIDEYVLSKPLEVVDDKLILFSYNNVATHRSFTAYFHEETSEFKVHITIGLNEFCITDFFASDSDKFIELLHPHMEDTIKKISTPIDTATDPFIRDQHFPNWSYIKNLPETVEGFELFISPIAPVKFTNGSYIILNYVDFETNSDFSIFYNFYFGQFSGESRVNGVSHISYIFDSATLEELQKKLEENLVDELRRIKNK